MHDVIKTKRRSSERIFSAPKVGRDRGAELRAWGPQVLQRRLFRRFLCAATSFLLIGALSSACHEQARAPTISLDEDANKGWTLLHAAARNCDAPVAELLIDRGADLNARGNEGETPLLLAVMRQCRSIVELLVTRGAELDLTMHKPKVTPLCWAIGTGSCDIAEFLTSKGADPNAACGADRGTVLHTAALMCPASTAEALVARSMNVNAKGNSGGTALHSAAMGARDDSAQVVSLLISNGANVNARTVAGVTPLHIACGRCKKDIIEALIRGGADERAKDNFGKTASDYARKGNCYEMAASLGVREDPE